MKVTLIKTQCNVQSANMAFVNNNIEVQNAGKSLQHRQWTMLQERQHVATEN
jgi:hypothetical protein